MPKVEIEVNEDEFKFIEKFIGVYENPDAMKKYIFEMGLAEMLRTIILEEKHKNEWVQILHLLMRGYEKFFDDLHEGAEEFGKALESFDRERSKDVL